MLYLGRNFQVGVRIIGSGGFWGRAQANIIEYRVNKAGLSHGHELWAIGGSGIGGKSESNSKKIFNGFFVAKEKIFSKGGFKIGYHVGITIEDATIVGIKGDYAIVAYENTRVDS